MKDHHSANWHTVKLSDLCGIARGGSPRPIKNYVTDDPEGINWIKIGDTEVGGRYIEDWRIDYNTERPHSSLKYQTPEEFAAARPFDKTQWAQPLERPDGSAPAPIAHAAE